MGLDIPSTVIITSEIPRSIGVRNSTTVTATALGHYHPRKVETIHTSGEEGVQRHRRQYSPKLLPECVRK